MRCSTRVRTPLPRLGRDSRHCSRQLRGLLPRRCTDGSPGRPCRTTRATLRERRLVPAHCRSAHRFEIKTNRPEDARPSVGAGKKRVREGSQYGPGTRRWNCPRLTPGRLSNRGTSDVGRGRSPRRRGRFSARVSSLVSPGPRPRGLRRPPTRGHPVPTGRAVVGAPPSSGAAPVGSRPRRGHLTLPVPYRRDEVVVRSRFQVFAACRSVLGHAPATLVSLRGRSGGRSRLRFPGPRGTRSDLLCRLRPPGCPGVVGDVHRCVLVAVQRSGACPLLRFEHMESVASAAEAFRAGLRRVPP